MSWVAWQQGLRHWQKRHRCCPVLSWHHNCRFKVVIWRGADNMSKKLCSLPYISSSPCLRERNGTRRWTPTPTNGSSLKDAKHCTKLPDPLENGGVPRSIPLEGECTSKLLNFLRQGSTNEEPLGELGGKPMVAFFFFFFFLFFFFSSVSLSLSLSLSLPRSLSLSLRALSLSLSLPLSLSLSTYSIYNSRVYIHT